ncbi:MAG: Uma2 family endonuclease [Deltaproteobacteria bacterium]|nr:Uma2 family endonuclease [Deltaproteobacteria bacterium]
MTELWTPPGAPAHRIRRLRRTDYDRLIESGAFDHERVELVRGVIVEMAPHGPIHAALIQRLSHLLLPPLLSRALVRVQLPLLGPDESEPEPDLAVVPLGDYLGAHPSAAHCVIEVADTTLAYDRETKGPLYAAMGVAEYWIVNVRGDRIDVYREPSDDGYAVAQPHRRGQRIGLLAFPDVTIDPTDVLP